MKVIDVTRVDKAGHTDLHFEMDDGNIYVVKAGCFEYATSQTDDEEVDRQERWLIFEQSEDYRERYYKKHYNLSKFVRKVNPHA